MILLDIGIQYRVIIGISAMVLLFTSFLIAFVTNQRKKIQYHKNLQAIQEEQHKNLMKQNSLLEDRVNERTKELSIQKDNLQLALADLKKSQLQIIQKEKMASLGELTSGIAHEIQNPLNFVINFSDITSELIEEIKEILVIDPLSNSLKNKIEPMLERIEVNLTKILNHGKRADNIVKSMLQHTRMRSGKIETTHINTLIEEYGMLSYQNFIKINPNYKCSFQRLYDKALGEKNLNPQDIGSLMFNLLNNAFYSTLDKKRSQGEPYNPTIMVATKMKGDRVEISVWDNGMGIPPKILDKIYQPFFTTKPTGEGTGLGLSLSYEIVKSYEGELKVHSVEGDYAEFTILLPL